MGAREREVEAGRGESERETSSGQVTAKIEGHLMPCALHESFVCPER